MNCKYKPKKLFLEGYDYRVWPKNEEELTDKKESIDKEEYADKKESIDKRESVDSSDMPALRSDEEWIARCFLFCFRYSRLYQIYH